MRITEYIRDVFIRNVLNDVPEVDYTEQIRTIATADLMKQVPKEVLALFENEKLRGWVAVAGLCVGATPRKENGLYLEHDDRFDGVNVFGIPCGSEKLSLGENARRRTQELGRKTLAQRKEREALRIKLKTLTRAYTTTQTLAKAVPEFAKYLPKESAFDRSVPVVANVLTDFVKAGWPKGKKGPKRAADRVAA